MMYLDRFGIYERNRKETMKHFFQSKTFQKHMASLFPLDLFYFVFGFTGRATLLRIPRLLRAYHFEDLFERLDNAFKFPMTIRLTRTINIMLFLIHLTLINTIISLSPTEKHAKNHLRITCLKISTSKILLENNAQCF